VSAIAVCSRRRPRQERGRVSTSSLHSVSLRGVNIHLVASVSRDPIGFYLIGATLPMRGEGALCHARLHESTQAMA
jgi:hypothetical protein